jgi:hypothetical protein
MWLSGDGLINLAAIPNPEQLLDEPSYERLVEAPDEELERLMELIEAVEVEAHDELENRSWTEEEVDYEDEALPRDWGIAFGTDMSLAENVEQLKVQVDLRWRLDAALVPTTVIRQIQDERHGSRLTRWVRRITRR